jgi:hypothetical protein
LNYGGGGNNFAVSVTVPGWGVSSVVDVGDRLSLLDGVVVGKFCSLVRGLGVV